MHKERAPMVSECLLMYDIHLHDSVSYSSPQLIPSHTPVHCPLPCYSVLLMMCTPLAVSTTPLSSPTFSA